MSAIKYLKEKEWIMGNGQCPECYGVPPVWHGHPLHLTSDSIGHKPDCKLASAIRDAGGHPIMIGEYKSEIEYEDYITDSGFLSTRLKTEHGCPKVKAFNDECQKKMDEILFKILLGDKETSTILMDSGCV